MPLVDFRLVRELISMEEVLCLIEYPSWVGRWPQFKGRCPLRCSNRKHCCSINLEKRIWNCHRCKQGGNHLDLYARVKGLPIHAAAIELCNRTGRSVPWL